MDRRMDSSALETFLAVHRRGGVSSAADALARTQSAISRRLALLEDELGTPLFERVGRRMVLSEAGAALLPHAERVAAAIDDAQAAIEGVKTGAAGRLRVVAVGTLADAALSRTLQRVRAEHAGLDLRLHTATSTEVSAQVRAGAATIGLRYFADRSAELDCRVVRHEALVVACAPTHPLAGKRVRTLARLATERWLAFPLHEQRSESHATTVFAQFQARGIHELDWVAIDSLTAQKRLLEAGFGIALLQASALDEELARRRLSTIRVDDLRVRIPVTCVLRKGGYLSGGAQALLRALRVASATHSKSREPIAASHRAARR
jgi:DNA-binding transcriptional LysR family regulator